MPLLLILLLNAAKLYGSTIKEILTAQGNALDRMEVVPSRSVFKLNELITDLAITKKGIIGISTLSARKAIEIRWLRKSALLLSKEENRFQVAG
jgi:hypothetical protein